MQMLNDSYKIIDVIGKGGMSTVYLAEHLQWKNRWAVKQAHKDIGISFDVLAEPNMLKQLSHPALPHIIDIFEDENDLYIVEEYIEGEDLYHYVSKNGPVPEETAVRWLRALCDVLHYLHEQNPPIIYRDLKPANIMLRRDGTLCLVDFGIARTYKEGSYADTLYAGTRGYAAPEQLTGRTQTDPRTDIYALGATIYHFVTGKPPVFLSDTFMPLGNIRPDLSARFVWIVEKCLRPSMEDRYYSTSEILADLDMPADQWETKGSVTDPRRKRAERTGSSASGASGSTWDLRQNEDLSAATTPLAEAGETDSITGRPRKTGGGSRRTRRPDRAAGDTDPVTGRPGETSNSDARRQRSRRTAITAAAFILTAGAVIAGILFSGVLSPSGHSGKTCRQGISHLFPAAPAESSSGSDAHKENSLSGPVSDMSEILFEEYDETQEQLSRREKYTRLAALLYDSFSAENYTHISELLKSEEYSALYSDLCSDLETGDRYFLYAPDGSTPGSSDETSNGSGESGGSSGGSSDGSSDGSVSSNSGISSGNVLAVYQYGFLYFGQWSDGIRQGQGVWYAPGDVEDLLYRGAWSEDAPNGEGTVYSRAVSRLEEWGDVYPALQTRKGTFTDGYYDGTFDIRWEMNDGTTREYTPVKYTMGISSTMTEEELMRSLISYGYPEEQAKELAKAHSSDTPVLSGENPSDKKASNENSASSIESSKKIIAICQDSTGTVYSMIELLEDGSDRLNDVFGIHILR